MPFKKNSENIAHFFKGMMKLTKLYIDESILQRTDRCKKNFACLTGEECLCEIGQDLYGNNPAIIYDRNKPCQYKVSMGNTMLCSCPTRKEIYALYNI